ncbi:MAG: hypothetical protein HYY18_18505 [Planctomycetes bacterium]|nr:hypothetical protein [Planctomycetota bacterium]
MRPLLLPLALLAGSAAAQTPSTWLDAHNAAYAYGDAASRMTVFTDGQQAIGERISRGEAAWDEKALGPLLDANQEALCIMRDGSREALCDFHPNISEGFFMSLGYLTLTRKLARLNAWDAARSLALARGPVAADAYIAGFRMAAHVGSDGPLIQGLVGCALFSITAEGLHHAIARRLLDVPTLRRIETALRELPPDIVDWKRVMACERASSSAGLDIMLKPKDPAEFFAALRGMGASEIPEDTIKKKYTDEELAIAKRMLRGWADDYLKFFDRQTRAFLRPWPEADFAVRKLDEAMQKQSPLTRLFASGMEGINGCRGRTAAARGCLIALCAIARVEETTGEDPVSLRDLDVPPDPFTGENFRLDLTTEGYEVSSEGKYNDEKPVVYRMKPR